MSLKIMLNEGISVELCVTFYQQQVMIVFYDDQTRFLCGTKLRLAILSVQTKLHVSQLQMVQ